MASVKIMVCVAEEVDHEASVPPLFARSLNSDRGYLELDVVTLVV